MMLRFISQPYLSTKFCGCSRIGIAAKSKRTFQRCGDDAESIRGAIRGQCLRYSVTLTGVPIGAFSKNLLAIPFGKRMQPWEAAKGGT